MNKPTIICIIGKSGSGKSLISGYIEQVYGYELIESRTTRQPRTPDEKGHAFVSDVEFDKYKKEDMIAFTEFGDYRYCCLLKDVHPKSIYVIDEFGLKYLKEHFSEDFVILSLKVERPYYARVKSVGTKRVRRDRGKFTMKDEEFDWVIQNQENDVGVCLEAVDAFMWFYKKM